MIPIEVRAFNPHLGHKDEVIAQYLKMVHKAAARYKNIAFHNGISYEDLFSEGSIGLLKAFDRFDPTRFEGRVTKFSTYAFPMIIGEIQRFLRDKGQSIKTPRTVQALYYSILRNDLLGQAPEEIAERLNVRVEKVEDALEFGRISQALSLEKPIVNGKNDQENLTVLDTIETSDDLSSVMVEDFLSSLPGVYRLVAEKRMIGASQAEIGKFVKCSQVHVHRMLEKVEGALRDYLEGREITITTKATADFFSESVGKVVEEVASAKAAVKEITKEDYLMLKEQGKSDKEISKLYGFSHNTMNQRKKSWGLVDLPKVSPKRKVPAPQQEKEKAPAGSGSAEVKSFEIRLFKLQNDLEQKEKENEALRNLVLVLFDKK